MNTQENAAAALQSSLWVWSASIFCLSELSYPILESADTPHQLRLTLQEGCEDSAGQGFFLPNRLRGESCRFMHHHHGDGEPWPHRTLYLQN